MNGYYHFLFKENIIGTWISKPDEIGMIFRHILVKARDAFTENISTGTDCRFEHVEISISNFSFFIVLGSPCGMLLYDRCRGKAGVVKREIGCHGIITGLWLFTQRCAGSRSGEGNQTDECSPFF